MLQKEQKMFANENHAQSDMLNVFLVAFHFHVWPFATLHSLAWLLILI